MVARLGNVLYWAGCALAGLMVFLALGEAQAHWGSGASLWESQYLIGAVLFWTVGRALRYILAGT